MKHHGCRLVVAVWAVLLPPVATADPITLLSVDRFSISSISGPDVGHVSDDQSGRDVLATDITAATDAGAFTVSATLDSQVSAANGLFFGTGSAFMSANPTQGREIGVALSVYQLEFELSSPQRYSFQIRSSGTEPGAFVSAFFFPSDAINPTRLFSDDFRNGGPMTLDTSGVLPAGQYRFSVGGLVSTQRLDAPDFQDAGRIDYSFQLRLGSQASPTPEPASLSLLATGAIIGGARRFRKRRAMPCRASSTGGTIRGLRPSRER